MSIAEEVRALCPNGIDTLGVAAIAKRLGAPYKAVEGALHRMRNLEKRRGYERLKRRADPGNTAYAGAYQRVLRLGHSVEFARQSGRHAARLARTASS